LKCSKIKTSTETTHHFSLYSHLPITKLCQTTKPVKMKQLLPILLGIFLLACQSDNKDVIPTTIIKGTIQLPPLRTEENIRNNPNYLNSLEERQIVSLVSDAIRNGIEMPNHTTKIDAAGNYEFRVKIKDVSEVRLIHLRQQLPLMVSPGSELVVNLHFTNQEKWNGKQYQISGGSAAISEAMITYNNLFRDSFEVELNATLPYFIPNEFKTQRARITNRIERFTQKYIAQHTANDEKLTNWIMNHTNYRIGMDYLKYAFKRHNPRQFSPDLKESFPSSYFDFWETYPIENPAALNSLNYQNYLQLYQKYLFAKLRLTTPYQDCKSFPNCNPYEMEVDQIKQNLSGEVKDIILAQQVDYHLIRNDQGFLKNGFPLFMKEITDSLKMESVLARKQFLYEERPFEFPSNASLIQSDATGKKILMRIAEQNANRPTILYFWNTQRPVIYTYFSLERSLERSLEKLDSMNYNLVMLAHHSAVNVWKEKIVDIGLTGEQWHLTDAQFEFFYNYFQENRKTHVNYDRFRDRENFLLLINGDRNLSTLDNRSFRENSFSYLSNLPYKMSQYERDIKSNRIITK